MSGPTNYGSNASSSQYGGMDRTKGLQQPLGYPQQTPMDSAFSAGQMPMGNAGTGRIPQPGQAGYTGAPQVAPPTFDYGMQQPGAGYEQGPPGLLTGAGEFGGGPRQGSDGFDQGIDQFRRMDKSYPAGGWAGWGGYGGGGQQPGATIDGAMGNAGTGGIPQQGQAGWGGYGGGGSRGQVPRYQWDPTMGRGPATPIPTPAPPAPGGPPVSAPPGGPYPGPKAGGGGVDHMANLRTLMGEDPRLAQEYRTRNGDTINWWQQNQGNVAQQLFGGDNAKMQDWLRNTTATSSNAAPLSQAEMMRLNQMAGIQGPSWMR